LRGSDGDAIGVAGLDLQVKQAVASLRDVELDDLQAVLLIKQSTGGILIDTSEGNDGSGYVLDHSGDTEKDLTLIQSPGLRAELSKGKPTGAVIEGDTTWVYARLRSIEWTLVARIAN